MVDSHRSFSVLQLFIVLARHKRFILGAIIFVSLVAAGVSLLVPNVYSSTARILPPQQAQSSAAAVLQQIGGLASLAGASSGLKSPSDLYIGMLRSRTIADQIIMRFDLGSVYDEKYLSDTRKMLDKATAISAGKDGIVTITVDDKSAARAAAIANAYVDELYGLTRGLALTESSQRRVFFENQLKIAKSDLAAAEAKAKSAIDNGGLVKVDDQGRGLIETTARLRAQATAKEVQISAMQTYAAGRNPQLIMAKQELAALKSELARIEGSKSQINSNANSSEFASGLNSVALIRDVKYQEAVYELMAKQFEIAKVDEAKESTLIQVIDQAIEADQKTRPHRGLIVLIAALAAALIASLVVLLQEGLVFARAM